MARLRKCPDCKHKVSKRADACPNCGYRFSQKWDEIRASNIIKPILWLGVLIFLVSLIPE
ncbi:zinc ribbon domain-containing protein [Glaciecola sp. SC05]|uniref:zinc ribbon domain-containing protein n=1 Tax=Glaciecola sp. SC05 TaxID=1987355 RepID=UPI003527DE6F